MLNLGNGEDHMQQSQQNLEQHLFDFPHLALGLHPR
jgi:hypothetical protein